MNSQPSSVTANQVNSSNNKQPVTPCPRCRKPLLPGEPVYYLHPKYSDRVAEPCCPDCFTRHATPLIKSCGGTLDAAKKSLLTRYSTVPNHQEFACVECRRPVWKRPRKTNTRVFCTPDCSARFYNRKALQLKTSNLKSLLTTCNTCGGAIPNNRRGDVRYCSPACRQKAYRQRQQGAVL